MELIRTGTIIPFRRPASLVHIPGFQQPPYLRLVVSNDNSQETLFARLEESRKAHGVQTQRVRAGWATKNLETIDELIFDDCLESVGRIEETGTAGYEKVKEIIQGVTILEDITELLVAADQKGYRTVFCYGEGTTIFVEYKQESKNYILWKYHKDTKAVLQVEDLQRKEPKFRDEYQRRKCVAEDIGVLIRTDDEKIYASLRVERKKQGVYSPPLQRTYATLNQAVQDFQEYIPLNMETIFLREEEKTLFEEGKDILFGLSFRGFRYFGDDQALRCVLKSAYSNGIQKGILRILENVNALYHK